MNIEEKLAELIEFGKREYGLVIEPKESKWYWRVMGKIISALSFGKIDFMNNFFSTFGNKIGTTPSWDVYWIGSKYEIVLHEMEHLRQKKKFGLGSVWLGTFIMGFAYLFLPLPIGLAWCRAELEKQAFAESIRARIQTSGLDHAMSLKSVVVKSFTGVDYFFMWPFKNHISKWFDETVKKVLEEERVKREKEVAEKDSRP